MKTFKGEMSLSFKIVATDQFLADLRASAVHPESKAFLKATQEAHPVNDDAFLEAVLKNGMRQHVRLNLLELFEKSPGLGATVAPAAITMVAQVPEHDAPVNVQVITKEAANDAQSPA